MKYSWVMSHVWTRHVSHMNESCHVERWFMWHLSYVTRMHKSCHLHGWVMVHVCKNHDTHKHEPSLTHTKMSQVSSLIESCPDVNVDMTQSSHVQMWMWTWLNHTWDLTHLDMPHPHATFTCECGIYTREAVMSMCRVTHICKSCHTYEYIMAHAWMSHVTQIRE